MLNWMAEEEQAKKPQEPVFNLAPTIGDAGPVDVEVLKDEDYNEAGEVKAVAEALADRPPEEMDREMAAVAKFKTYPASCITPPGDENADPAILFRNNWLAYGQSVILVSSTGVGKSSLAVQAALNWAGGRTFLAEPKRRLRVCIIQSEDSTRDLQEQMDGMRWGLRNIDGWTDKDLALAEENVCFSDDFIGLVGEAFIGALADYQRVMRFDIIVINPIQAFFGGDVSDQESVSKFVRAGLDPVMKSAEAPCCIFVVAHTSKQQSGKKDGQNNVDDYGEYMMSGSHEWADWARAVFAFLKEGKSDSGLFALRAAKRGRRLKWRDEFGEPTTKKLMKHSQGHIYWQGASSEDDPALVEARRRMADKMAKLADYLKEHADYQRHAKIAWKASIVNDCWAALRNRLAEFGLVEGRVGAGMTAKYVIGTKEGVAARIAEIEGGGEE